jgi:hypothetical protein
MPTIVHVSQPTIGANLKTGSIAPVLTVIQPGQTPCRTCELYVAGPCWILYRPDRPLSSGIRLWLQTEAAITPVRPAVAPVRGARKAVVHVNQHRIKDNARTGRIAPAIAVKEGTCNRYCHELYVAGPSWFIYRPHKPLPCGARVWLETYAQCSLIVRCGEED